MVNMINIGITASIPAVGVIAGLIALCGKTAFRKVTVAAGLLIATPLAVIGNVLIPAAVSSGMIPAATAWYGQVIAVPLLTLLAAIICIRLLRRIAGTEALDSELPVVVGKAVSFCAVAFSSMMICAVLLLPLLSSPYRQILPAAKTAAKPATKVMEYAARVTMHKCDGRDIAGEVFKISE